MSPGLLTFPLTLARPLCSLLLSFLLITVTAPQATAEELTEAIAAIGSLGGKVRRLDGGWEVDFHLRGRKLADEELKQVSALKPIVWLNLSQTRITSAGLVHLRELEQLRWLHLEKTEVSDEGIQHVAGLPNLEYLNLYATNITDKTLDQLAACKNLKRLYLWQTAVTDAGVTRLKEALPQLKVIGGLDLSKLPSSFSEEGEEPPPKRKLKWVAVSTRQEAPARSENGINAQVLFENQSTRSVKLYWISYGSGQLKLYATLPPGATRQQNSYSRNAWLVTDENDQPLGYFVVADDNARAIIPQQE